MPPIRLLIALIFSGFPFAVVSQTELYNVKEATELTDKAELLYNQLNFKESMLTAREALKHSIYLKNSYLIARSYNIIGCNFDELSENDKAISNYKTALVYATRSKNDSLQSVLNNNLGSMYCFEKKQYDVGIKFFQKALKYGETQKDSARLVLTHLNITWAYFDVGDFKSGLPHLKFINSFYSTYPDNSLEAIRAMLNGMYHARIHDNELAKQFFDQAITLAKLTRQDQDLMYAYQEYSRFLLAKGDYKSAYEYLDRYDNTREDIYDNEKLAKADIEGVNVQLDEYKRALEKIETERKMQALRLKKSRVVAGLFIVGVVILLGLLYALYKNFNLKKKMNLELTVANEELKTAKEKAEEASQLKSQFVSTISHELRTPLYGVVGITNMILDEHKELAGSTHLNSLKFSAKYLLSLVNDILQINKIEENRLVLETMTFNVSDEINTIMNSLQFIAARNNNSLVAEIDTDIPEFVIGDKLRLSQIFMNLVSNALKFTKNGEVVIAAELDRVEEKMHFIKFSIRDNGIGIAKADQSKIFEKFVQIERKNDDYQGTGLGLSIVKRLIALFKSEIHLESNENEGTCFTFTIGFEVDPDKSAEIIQNIEVHLTSGQIFSVLVVEDNKINQMVTKKIIENNNFTCSVVDDGYAAIELLRAKSFDIVLMDINMPGINGFETTRKIRELGLDVPIVALTAFGKEEIAEEAISSGMNDVIIKPFEPLTLFRVINNQVNKVKSTD
ncbi:MAG: response regulator [Flavobacterium sp.]|nr:MAG: response regulator [Flavobacterium sp.]